MYNSLKLILKKIIPLKIVLILKLGVEFPYFAALIRKIETTKTPVDLMIGTPVHTNLGDHFITMAQKSFLKNIGYTRTVLEIPMEVFQIFRERLKRAISRSSLIFINGGGWMGSLWPVEELILQEMVTCFSNNRIIIFPQTIYYDPKEIYSTQILESGRKAFANCLDLTLCVRDDSSLQQAKLYFPWVKLLLVPDIALSYSGEAPRRVKLPVRNVAGMCFRKDRENARNAVDEDILRDMFRKYNFKMKAIDTISFFRVPAFLRNWVVKRRLMTFAECNIVVTDRLHGMIFAFITSTPCIILDNKTNKVSGIYRKWLSHCEYIYPLFENKDEKAIELFILSMVNKLCLRRTVVQDEFDPLKEVILHG